MASFGTGTVEGASVISGRGESKAGLLAPRRGFPAAVPSTRAKPAPFAIAIEQGTQPIETQEAWTVAKLTLEVDPKQKKIAVRFVIYRHMQPAFISVNNFCTCSKSRRQSTAYKRPHRREQRCFVLSGHSGRKSNHHSSRTANFRKASFQNPHGKPHW